MQADGNVDHKLRGPQTKLLKTYPTAPFFVVTNAVYNKLECLYVNPSHKSYFSQRSILLNSS